VVAARAAGLSWQKIGALLGTSAQAAQQRYGTVVEASKPPRRAADMARGIGVTTGVDGARPSEKRRRRCRARWRPSQSHPQHLPKSAPAPLDAPRWGHRRPTGTGSCSRRRLR
jgi:hypothetical protein